MNPRAHVSRKNEYRRTLVKRAADRGQRDESSAASCWASSLHRCRARRHLRRARLRLDGRRAGAPRGLMCSAASGCIRPGVSGHCAAAAPAIRSREGALRQIKPAKVRAS